MFNDKGVSKRQTVVAAGIAVTMLAFWVNRPVAASRAAPPAALVADSLPAALASIPGGEHRLLLSDSGVAGAPASLPGEMAVDSGLERALVLVPPPAWAGLLVLAAMAFGRSRQRRRFRRRR